MIIFGSRSTHFDYFPIRPTHFDSLGRAPTHFDFQRPRPNHFDFFPEADQTTLIFREPTGLDPPSATLIFALARLTHFDFFDSNHPCQALPKTWLHPWSMDSDTRYIELKSSCGLKKIRIILRELTLNLVNFSHTPPRRWSSRRGARGAEEWRGRRR